MDPRFQHSTRARGFTLIEILVVVAIIGILAGIAVPTYRDYVLRAHMTEAFSGLGTVQPAAEEYWNSSSPHTYAGFDRMPAATATFTFELTVATDSAYTVTARGKDQMAGFVYTIDQNGSRTSTGPTGWGQSSTCWIDHRGGQCSQ